MKLINAESEEPSHGEIKGEELTKFHTSNYKTLNAQIASLNKENKFLTDENDKNENALHDISILFWGDGTEDRDKIIERCDYHKDKLEQKSKRLNEENQRLQRDNDTITIDLENRDHCLNLEMLKENNTWKLRVDEAALMVKNLEEENQRLKALPKLGDDTLKAFEKGKKWTAYIRAQYPANKGDLENHIEILTAKIESLIDLVKHSSINVGSDMDGAMERQYIKNKILEELEK